MQRVHSAKFINNLEFIDENAKEIQLFFGMHSRKPMIRSMKDYEAKLSIKQSSNSITEQELSILNKLRVDIKRMSQLRSVQTYRQGASV